MRPSPAAILLLALLLPGACAPHRLPPEQLRADLDVLLGTIERVHPEAPAGPPAEFRRQWRRLESQVDRPMTVAEFYRLAAPVVASLRVGHTMLHPPEAAFEEYLELSGTVWPLEIRLVEGQPCVAGTYGSASLPVGARILAVDGRPADEAIRRLARFYPAEGRTGNPPRLEDPWLLWIALWLDCGSGRPLPLKLERPDGTVETLQVPPEPGLECAREIGRRRSTPGWADYASRWLPASGTMVLDVNSFTGRETFVGFATRAFREARDKGANRMVLDLRGNPGGRRRLAAMLMSFLTDRPFRLYDRVTFRNEAGEVVTADVPLTDPGENPLRFGGRTAVLVDEATGSASVAFAAAVRHYGLGVVVGRPPLEPTVSHGNPRRIVLPHTELRAGVASCTARCVGTGERPAPLTLDERIPARPPSPDGPDPMLDRAVELLSEGDGR
jgi:hypothetical protein